MFEVVLWVGLYVGFLVLLWIGASMAKARRRRDGMRRIAGELGGEFHPQWVADLGAPPHAHSFVHVENAWAYLYGNARDVFADTGIDIGRLIIRPEGATDRIVEAFGGVDVDVASATFSETFRVEAERPRAAQALFSDRMIELLLRRPTYWWLMTGGRLSVSAPGSRSGASYPVRDLIEAALEFCELIPRHVREDYPRV